jgi:hypothetical protein
LGGSDLQKRYSRFHYIFALALALGVSCAGPAKTPLDPELSKHFRTTSGLFEINRNTKQARYFMSYAVVEPFLKPVLLRVEFENPIESTAPFVVERTLNPTEDDFEVESPILAGFQSGGSYRAVLVALDISSGLELARHTQLLRFLMPPAI